MARIPQTGASVNEPPTLPASDDLQTRLRRDVGIHRAAQLLADAHHCLHGSPTQPLSAMRPYDAMWYRQTARQMIELFEQITGEPDAALTTDDDSAPNDATTEVQ